MSSSYPTTHPDLFAQARQGRQVDGAGGHIAGSLWLSRDGIPLKCDGKFEPKNGKRSTIYWELRDVKLGKQDEALFEVPHGYAKLSPEAAAPLLGMRLATPPAH